MSPFSGGESRPAAGREPPLASAATSGGMVRRKVGKLFSLVLTTVMFVRALQTLIQQLALSNLQGLKASFYRV